MTSDDSTTRESPPRSSSPRTSATESPVRPIQHIDGANTPAWIQRIFRNADTEVEEIRDSDSGSAPKLDGTVELRVSESDGISLVSARGPRFGALDPVQIRATARICYAALTDQLRTRRRFPMRIWNFVPWITTRDDETGLTGYEAFNMARFECYAKANDLQMDSAAASAVDVLDDRFSIHALIADEPGTPVRNPRQIQPRDYSKRYGPRPPVFARGIRVPDAIVPPLPCSIISGTASIVGEASSHLGDLPGQLQEVTANLETMAVEAYAADGTADSTPRGLADYSEIRIYIPTEADEAGILEWARRSFSERTEIEVARAELCRPELLLEIEGILGETSPPAA